MLDIKILGPGCSNCFILRGLTIATLEFMAEDKAGELDLEEVTLQHLTQPADFQRYNLFSTPGLVINEKLVCAGRLPSALEIRQWMSEATEPSADEE